MAVAHVELQAISNYSFLRGASHVEELLVAAQALGLDAIALTDWNTLAGIARAHARAAGLGIRLIIGCRIHPSDSLPLLVYPTDRAAYGRLCRLLTIGKGRAGKGGCDLSWRDVVAYGEGLLLILLPDQPDTALPAELTRMATDFPDRSYLSLCLRRHPPKPSRSCHAAPEPDQHQSASGCSSNRSPASK